MSRQTHAFRLGGICMILVGKKVQFGIIWSINGVYDRLSG